MVTPPTLLVVAPLKGAKCIPSPAGGSAGGRPLGVASAPLPFGPPPLDQTNAAGRFARPKEGDVGPRPGPSAPVGAREAPPLAGPGAPPSGRIVRRPRKDAKPLPESPAPRSIRAAAAMGTPHALWAPAPASYPILMAPRAPAFAAEVSAGKVILSVIIAPVTRPTPSPQLACVTTRAEVRRGPGSKVARSEEARTAEEEGRKPYKPFALKGRLRA